MDWIKRGYSSVSNYVSSFYPKTEEKDLTTKPKIEPPKDSFISSPKIEMPKKEKAQQRKNAVEGLGFIAKQLEGKLGEEGIFRIPGDKNEVDTLANRLRNGEKVDLSNTDVPTLAGAYKNLLKGLQKSGTPLINKDTYEGLKKILDTPEREQRLKLVEEAFENNPGAATQALMSVLELLRNTLKQQAMSGEKSKLTPDTLATVIATNLFPEASSIEQMKLQEEMKLQNNIIAQMLKDD